MSMVDRNAGPPVSQLPSNALNREENGPENNAEGNISLTPEEQKEYLDDAMKFVRSKEQVTKSKGKVAAKSKDKVTKCIDKLNDLDPTKSKYMDLHELQRLLKLGKEHEAQLKKDKKQSDKLEVTTDRKKEKTFPPYCIFGKRVQKSLSHNPKKLPDFKVNGNETPTQYAEKCVKIRRKTIEAKYQLVKSYLSKYHQDMIGHCINSMMNNLATKQKSKAQDELEKHRSENANTQSNTNTNPFESPLLGSASVPSTRDAVPPNCVEYDYPVREEAIPPTSNVTGTQKRDSTNVVCISSNSNESDTSRKRRRTEVHPSEGEQEVAAVPGLTIPIPPPLSPSQTLPNFSLQEATMNHNQHHHENNNTSHLRTLNPVLMQTVNQPWDAPMSHPYNNSIDQSNEMPDSAHLLQIDMFRTLYSNCSNDVSCLIASVGNGASGSGKGLFTREFESAMKRESIQGVPCKSYRNVVDNMCEWVVQDQNEGEFRSSVTQLVTHALTGDPNMIELHARNAAEGKMTIWLNRADVVQEFLSPIEFLMLLYKIEDAKITFKRRAVAELLKHVSQEGRCEFDEPSVR